MSRAKAVIPLIACVAAAALGLGLGWALGAFDTTPSPAPVISTGTANIGGPFDMTDQNGQPTDEQILKGKWSAIFFGYTFCPDVCPLTLQKLNAAAGELGGAAKDFQIVFVSVDPERDTAAQIKAWLELQGLNSAIGLTGSPEQIAAMVKTYRAYASVPEDKAEGYLVDHSANAWLMDPDGGFVTLIPPSQSPTQIAATVRAAMDAR